MISKTYTIKCDSDDCAARTRENGFERSKIESFDKSIVKARARAEGWGLSRSLFGTEHVCPACRERAKWSYQVVPSEHVPQGMGGTKA